MYTWPEFKKHLMKKFNWSSEVFESVNMGTFPARGQEAKCEQMHKLTQIRV
jgi:hypothetical protein